MRLTIPAGHLAAVVFLAHLALASGCDFAFAKSRTSRWLSQEALMGLAIHEKGGDVEGELYVYDDATKMPDPEGMGDEDRLFGLPLCAGIVDEETKTLVFPLQTNTLVQANSARALRANGASYVEFPLDFSKPTLEGRWRDGASPPKFTRAFVRCGKKAALPEPK